MAILPSINRFARNVKRIFGVEAAGADTDPHFFSRLQTLPNPDPVLRAMGLADTVYASIMADPHVAGEIRSIRGEMLGMDYRIVTWDEDNPKAQAARDLCEQWMQREQPNAAADWLETMWQMMAAVLTGYRVHEVVWDIWDGSIMPAEILDRPNRRFLFTPEGRLQLLTRKNPLGQVVDEPHRFLVSRNAASIQNPYGTALLSSCYWPWVFKTGGWKYFVKYCERHGLPWPVARYGVGASDKDQADLARAIEAMTESGYAIVPDGTGVELLVPTSSGSMLPQEALINLCNREMSKALTGQAMIAELTNVGARAASETALTRQSSINDADRGIAASSMSRLFRHITTFNFGEDVPSPELEFFKQKAAGKERAETYRLAADAGARPSKAAMLEELNIPQAKDDDDALLPTTRSTTSEFAAPRAAGVTLTQAERDEEARIAEATRTADAAIEAKILQPIADMLAQYEAEGRTLAEFQAGLAALLDGMDDTERRQFADQALTWSYLQGYVDSEADHGSA